VTEFTPPAFVPIVDFRLPAIAFAFAFAFAFALPLPLPFSCHPSPKAEDLLLPLQLSLRLYLPLPLQVFAVILSGAKDPEEANSTTTLRTFHPTTLPPLPVLLPLPLQ